MLKVERHTALLNLLSETGSLLVTEACEKLGCSGQTIRRDFQELEEKQLLKRIHGGAYLPSEEDVGVPVQLRALQIPKEKEKIAQITAKNFIQKDDVLLMDSSTTCFTLAKYILENPYEVTIITNSINIIHLFYTMKTKSKLICIGGRFNYRSGSFVGEQANEWIRNYVADKVFISCNALSQTHGMLDNYERQCSIRKNMLLHGKEKYLLVDHTKFDDAGSYFISHFEALNGIVTNKELPDSWQDYFSSLSLPVLWK